PGDLVAVHAPTGRQEGVVLDSYLDYAGRQIVKVQLGPGDIYHAWYPTITRVKRTIYTRPQQRTFERHVYW
ncbi:hypothetical protein BC827DRAFT_1133015, partial [Russula dissimulans]